MALVLSKISPRDSKMLQLLTIFAGKVSCLTFFLIYFILICNNSQDVLHQYNWILLQLPL